MPSGSRGGSSGRSGGGGSHFSGGGGSFRSSGGSSNGHRHRIIGGRPGRYRGATVFYFGRTHYMTNGAHRAASLLLVFFVISLFFLAMSMMILGGVNRGITTIQRDYRYYQQMIIDAENNPAELQVAGEITGRKCHEESGMWYLTYKFRADDGSMVNNGYTYAIYTEEEIFQFSVGDEILLAVESTSTNKNSDSVNMDFKDVPLEKDGEYRILSSRKNTYTIVTICVGCVGGALLISGIAVAAKGTKKVGTDVEQQITPESVAKKVRYCNYCGAKLAETGNCRQCGAVESKSRDE